MATEIQQQINQAKEYLRHVESVLLNDKDNAAYDAFVRIQKECKEVIATLEAK